MPFDAVCLTAVLKETSEEILGGRVDKIFQPARDEIVLAVRGKTANVRLLLTANPAHPRIQLTNLTRENPSEPPMFCRLLRKHLSGGRLLSIGQPPMERVVTLTFEATDELGDRVERRLILEAMGRRANLILADADGRILACLRRLEGDLTAQRQVAPGMFYRFPPSAEKRNPLDETEESLAELLRTAPSETELSALLLDSFGGLSPLICRELAWRIAGDTGIRLHELRSLETTAQLLYDDFQSIAEGKFTPVCLLQNGQPKDFSWMPIGQYEGAMELRTAESFASLLDSFYVEKETGERVRQIGQDLLKSLTAARDRTARRLNNQRKDLAAAANLDELRKNGDLITANLWRMEKGMRVLEAEDYYDEALPIVKVVLDPLLTPQQNAAKYYKNYNRAKTARIVLAEQIEKGESELDYLESVLQSVRLAEGERDLAEIRAELEDTGYLRRKKAGTGKKQMKRPAGKPMEFLSSTGMRISVGRNNTQNDKLTCKEAFKTDLWLHTQKIHGSHVILWTEGKDPDLQSVTEAAQLAAYYSRARESSNVPVDYTPVKFVRKPNGARPGMVVYDKYNTVYVTPDPALAEKLKK